jgi:peptidoglycan/LPS O-acetylase OafA/YrhL
LWDRVEKFTEQVAASIPIHFLASLVTFSIVLFGCTLVAVASFHLVEQPALRLKRHFEY